MITDQPVLVVVTGPTATGKTSIAIRLAQQFSCEIISADSRQFYKEMQIGTAMPSPEELTAIPHHFIGHLSIHDEYNIGRFETDALSKLEQLFHKSRFTIMVGGSGLYIRAVCHGIDLLPETGQGVRQDLNRLYASDGVQALAGKLKMLDPIYYEQVDRNNPVRLIRALEVCLSSGLPYSSFRNQTHKTRSFKTIKIGIDLSKQELNSRIGQRVDTMINKGLVEEARRLYPFRNLNALNTVGYKELFEYFDGKLTLPVAIEQIKLHTRQYAKRQRTWFRKDKEIHWFDPGDTEGIQNCIVNIADH